MAVNVIVEDGTVVANANSYVSVSDADTYFANSANDTWDNYDPTDQKAPYLVLATRFMQQTYRMRWQGTRYNVDQVLDWPRWNVRQFDVAGGYGPLPRYYPVNFIPQEIKDAQCELALRVGNGDLNPDIERLTISEQVGPIKVVYDPQRSPNTIFTAVELLLRPFLISSGNMVQVVRG